MPSHEGDAVCDSGRGRRGEARGPGSRPGEREASPGYRGSAEASRTAGSACLRLRAGRTGKRVDRGEDSRLWPCGRGGFSQLPNLASRPEPCALLSDEVPASHAAAWTHLEKERRGDGRSSPVAVTTGQREHPPRVTPRPAEVQAPGGRGRVPCRGSHEAEVKVSPPGLLSGALGRSLPSPAGVTCSGEDPGKGFTP